MKTQNQTQRGRPDMAIPTTPGNLKITPKNTHNMFGCKIYISICCMSRTLNMYKLYIVKPNKSNTL